MALITRAPGFSFFKKTYAEDVKRDAEEILDRSVYMIPNSENIYETHVKGVPISHHKPRSKVGKAYEKIVRELVEEHERQEEIERGMNLFEGVGEDG